MKFILFIIVGMLSMGFMANQNWYLGTIGMFTMFAVDSWIESSEKNRKTK